jgi:enoyl-CoA hydratase/carnithine racemase
VHELRREGDVFVLQLDDGENRFNASSIETLHGLVDEVEASTGPAALVLTGTGKFFSNGLDLDWMGSPEGRSHPTFFSELHRLLGRILGMEMITIAAINGHAFAAGAMLVCAHDQRVMRADRGYWCLNEVDLGLPLTPGMTALVTAGLPAATAHRALTTGARFTAADALAAGIVDETAAEADVLPRAIEIGAELASKRAPIMATLKRSLHGDAIDLLLAGGQG